VQCLFDILSVFNSRFDATDLSRHGDTPVS